MRDADIRTALLSDLASQYNNDAGTLVVEELIVGTARADIAVINGKMHGFEIKSEVDTLDRLPSQVQAYGSVFDQMTIVACERHLGRARHLIPDWWGITRARPEGQAGVRFEELRPPDTNPGIDPIALGWLLWRHEAVAALVQAGYSAGLRRKNRGQLAELLATAIPIDELSAVVRHQLRARVDWRSDALRT